MKPSDLRDKSTEELKKMIGTLEEEVFRLRFRKGSNQLKQISNIKKTRHDLARVNTIIRERELKAASAK